MIKNKFFSLFFLLLIFNPGKTKGQVLLGNSGGLNIPTAEMNPAGTFIGGLNFIEKGIISPEKGKVDHRWKFNYNTYSYYVNFTFFDWLEATFRETLLESNSYGKFDDYKFREQDRSVTIKVRPLKEGKYYPAVAFGVNDPYSFTGHHVYSSAWGVMTKNLHTNLLKSTFTATIGYAKAFDDSQMYDGFIGGIKWTPDWCKEVSLLAEYDSKVINVGIQGLLFRHLGFYGFVHDFDSYSAGIKYQTTIKF